MRILSKPSTATCTLPMYVSYLLAEPKRASCVRLGETISISHDSITRMLNRENYTPRDLFIEVKDEIVLTGGTVSVDDAVLDKPYSKLIPFVQNFWSGKHHRVVLGANLITLFYTDTNGVRVPVNFRLYDPADHKTKNDYFREMVTEVLSWGLKPAWVTGDSWYSGLENLKFIKNNGMGFLFAIKQNRILSQTRGKNTAAAYLNIPIQIGTEVYLPKFGYVTVYRTYFKNEVRHYIGYSPNQPQGTPLPISVFETLHSHHYAIEQYHRILKQVCHIEHFSMRNKTAVSNHIFCAIFAYVQLEMAKVKNIISNAYEIQRTLFFEVVAKFIQTHATQMPFINAHPRPAVNA